MFLGVQFAVYQTELGIIKIIENHAVEFSDKTHIPYEFDPTTFVLSPKDGIHLKIKRWQSNI